MDNLIYTNEFLKNLEEIVKKNDLETLKKLKKALSNISKNNCEKKILQNIKTHSNQNILQTTIDEKTKTYNIFWTEEKAQKTIISLIKRT